MSARGFRFESLPLLFIALFAVIGTIVFTCRSYIRAAWRDRKS